MSEEVEKSEIVQVEGYEKMTDWANEPSIADLKANIDDAEIDQDTHKKNVERWLENRAAVRCRRGRRGVGRRVPAAADRDRPHPVPWQGTAGLSASAACAGAG